MTLIEQAGSFWLQFTKMGMMVHLPDEPISRHQENGKAILKTIENYGKHRTGG